MSDVPCPKCGAEADLIGSKWVCSECYWVFEGMQSAAAPKSTPLPAFAPTDKRPAQIVSQAPTDANVPLPKNAAAQAQTPVSAPASAPGPANCPKCNGKTTDVGGKLICSVCYFFIDPAERAAATVDQAPRNAAAPAPTQAPTQAPASVSAPGPASCPKCNGKTTDVGGKLICSVCYFFIDPGEPVAAAADRSAKNAQAALPAPHDQAAKSVQAPLSAPISGTCPKCNGEVTDVGGRLVCSLCYFVVDPSKSTAAGRGQTAKDVQAPVSVPDSGTCPKCNGEATNVGGRLVCSLCYYTFDPLKPHTASRDQATAGDPAPTSSQAILGGIIIVLLIVIIVFLALPHH